MNFSLFAKFMPIVSHDRAEGRYQLAAAGGPRDLSVSEGSMSDDVAVISTFASDDECAHAIEALHAAHVRDFHAYRAVSRARRSSKPSMKCAQFAGRSPGAVVACLSAASPGS